MNFELSLFNTLHGLAGQSGFLDWFIVFVGKYLPYFLLLAVLLFVFLEKDWRASFYKSSFILLAAILSRGLITEIIRFFYFRARPFTELGFNPLIDHAATASFPSGHAAFYFAVAFAVFFFNRQWGWILTLSALLVGVARVSAGIHWPLDIFAGALVGAISFFVVKWLLVPERR